MSSQQYFDEVATQWDAMRSEFFSHKVRAKALAKAAVKQGEQAADIGAGSGFMSEALLEKGLSVFAVDQSQEMIRILEKKFGQYPNFSARLGEAEKLPLPANHVDYVFANMYLHHVEDPPTAIREMVRILKPGGTLIITDLDNHDFEFLMKEQHDRWMGFKREDMAGWFQNAGLRNVIVDCLDEKCCSSSQTGTRRAEISIFVATGTKWRKDSQKTSREREPEHLKNFMKQKYGKIAIASNCGCGCDTSDKSQDGLTEKAAYSQIGGYVREADLGLGCGIPTLQAQIKRGDTVVDLGAGAGLDVFAARALTGNTSKVIGIDFTEEMVQKARANNRKLGYENVEFHSGDIEDLPLPDVIADVVISNCALNLVPDKVKAFREIWRILKPGGHFCISDMVTRGELPAAIRRSAELYAGCIAGALPEKNYLKIIHQAGFRSVEIHQSTQIQLSDDVLTNYLPPDEIKNWDHSKCGIFGITISGYK